MSTILRKTLMSRLTAELARAAREATDLEVVDLGDESFAAVAAAALIELAILSGRRGRRIALVESDLTAINACAAAMHEALAEHCDAASDAAVTASENVS